MVAGGRARRDPRRPGRVRRRTGWRPHARGDAARSRPLAHRSRRARRRRLRSATSAPTPTTSRASSPGSRSSELSADLTTFVQGRGSTTTRGHAALQGRREGHALGEPGRAGQRERLTLRVYGTKGGLEWAQEDPNDCGSRPSASRSALITRGGAGAEGRGRRASPASARPPGRLSRRLRQHLHRGGPGHRRARRQEAGQGGAVPRHRRRRRRHRLHRGVREVVDEKRQVDKALTPSSH